MQNTIPIHAVHLPKKIELIKKNANYVQIFSEGNLLIETKYTPLDAYTPNIPKTNEPQPKRVKPLSKSRWNAILISVLTKYIEGLS